MGFARGLSQGLQPGLQHMAWDARTREDREWQAEQRDRKRQEQERQDALRTDVSRELSRYDQDRGGMSPVQQRSPELDAHGLRTPSSTHDPRPQEGNLGIHLNRADGRVQPRQMDLPAVTRDLAAIYGRHGHADTAMALMGQARTMGHEDEDRAWQGETRERQRAEWGHADQDRDWQGMVRSRQQTEWGQADEDRAAQQAEMRREREQQALQNLALAARSGDLQMMNMIVQRDADLLSDYLGEGRHAVGVDAVEGPDGEPMFALMVQNDRTGTTGPETRGASADPNDAVNAIPLSALETMAGMEPPEQHWGDTERGLLNRYTGEFIPHGLDTTGVRGGTGTSNAQRAEEMIERGFPRNIAEGIAYGSFRQVTDPSGLSLVIDMRTNRPVGGFTFERDAEGRMGVRWQPFEEAGGAGASPGQGGMDEIPIAPADPSQREVGMPYRSRSGLVAVWNGQRWEPLPE